MLWPNKEKPNEVDRPTETDERGFDPPQQEVVVATSVVLKPVGDTDTDNPDPVDDAEGVCNTRCDDVHCLPASHSVVVDCGWTRDTPRGSAPRVHVLGSGDSCRPKTAGLA